MSSAPTDPPQRVRKRKSGWETDSGLCCLLIDSLSFVLDQFDFSTSVVD
jgi:hypothetical protein